MQTPRGEGYVYHTDGPKPPGLDGEAMPRWVLNTPHGPSPNHHGLDTSLSVTMLQIARLAYAESFDKYPGLFHGMTIFGSTVKGRAHKGSDVDGFLLCDPDQMAARIPQPIADLQATISDRINVFLKTPSFPRRSRLRAIACNAALIDESIGFQSEVYKRAGRVLTPSLLLVAPFMMRVGPGKVTEIRKHIVDALAATDAGETIWQSIAQMLIDAEEGHRNARFVFPDTLEGASNYFSLASIAIAGTSFSTRP